MSMSEFEKFVITELKEIRKEISEVKELAAINKAKTAALVGGLSLLVSGVFTLLSQMIK